MKVFFVRSERRKGCPLSPFLSSIGLEVLFRAISPHREVKSTQTGKIEVKLVFADDTILYIGNLKESATKLISVKWQDAKINIEKSIAFHYTKYEASEKEQKKTISFTIASKTIKSLRVNLPNKVKHLCNENYKTLLQEIKDRTNGKASHIHGSEELVSLKCPNYPKPSAD